MPYGTSTLFRYTNIKIVATWLCVKGVTCILKVWDSHKTQLYTHLNTLEKFYIRKEYSNNNHLNEEYADNNNHIFNTILYVSNNMATNPPT